MMETLKGEHGTYEVRDYIDGGAHGVVCKGIKIEGNVPVAIK